MEKKVQISKVRRSKSLQLTKETLILLQSPDLANVVGMGASGAPPSTGFLTQGCCQVL